jgi:hypothetical protein
MPKQKMSKEESSLNSGHFIIHNHHLPGFVISDVSAMNLDEMVYFIDFIQYNLSNQVTELDRKNFSLIFINLPGTIKRHNAYFFFGFSINNILMYGSKMFRTIQHIIDYYKWVLDVSDRYEIVYNKNKNWLSIHKSPNPVAEISHEFTAKNDLKKKENSKLEHNASVVMKVLNTINFSGKKTTSLNKQFPYKEMMNAIPNTRSVLFHEIQILENKLASEKNILKQDTKNSPEPKTNKIKHPKSLREVKKKDNIDSAKNNKRGLVIPFRWEGNIKQLRYLHRELTNNKFIEISFQLFHNHFLLKSAGPKKNSDLINSSRIQWYIDKYNLYFLIFELGERNLILKENKWKILVQHFLDQKGNEIKLKNIASDFSKVKGAYPRPGKIPLLEQIVKNLIEIPQK